MQHVEREEEKALLLPSWPFSSSGPVAFSSSGPVAFSYSPVRSGVYHSIEEGEGLEKSSAIIPSSSQQPK
jgi:hypothetical protein